MVCLLLALPFAPRLYKLIQRHTLVVMLFAALASFLSMGLLEPNQEHRLFITPFSVWAMIAHVVALAFLLVWIATQPSVQNEPNQSASYSPSVLIGAYSLAIVVLMGLHIASVGEFMIVDTPDEPWLASMATNYAEHNDLSPSFIGSSYGTPDPILPRYYLLMGVWLKVTGSSLIAMRAIPLLVLMAVLIILFWALRKYFDFSLLQRLGAVIVLLSFMPLVRMSHNLRADVGLALYGVLMLWGMAQLFGGVTRRSRWIILMGISLYIGLETIPFIALILALTTGLMLIAYSLQQRKLRDEWKSIALYALTSALSLVLYMAVRLLPDIQTQWAAYQLFNKVYAQQTAIGTLHFPFESLLNYHGRFSLILSPVEFFVVIISVFLLWRWGKASNRWLLTTFGLSLVVMLTVTGFAFGYWTLFAPLIAYAVAFVLRSKRIILIASCVILPSIVAVPIFDLTTAIQTRPNETRILPLQALNDAIPPGTVLVGEDILWFALHQQRTFIGFNGFWVNYSGHQDRTVAQNLDALGVDALLIDTGNPDWKTLIDTGMYQLSDSFTIGNSTYQLYRRAQ